MPQNFKIDQTATFANMILLSTAPKLKFGSEVDQECTKDGTPKWEIQLAAGFSQFGKIQNEVLKVGIASEKDPTEGMSPYSPVELVGFELGVMEKTGKDGSVIGAQVWYRAEQIRSLSPSSAAQAPSKATAKADA